MIPALRMYSPRPPYELLRRCEQCYGRGWYPESVDGTDDYRERYCDCEAGKWRRIADGREPEFRDVAGEPHGQHGEVRP